MCILIRFQYRICFEQNTGKLQISKANTFKIQIVTVIVIVSSVLIQKYVNSKQGRDPVRLNLNDLNDLLRNSQQKKKKSLMTKDEIPNSIFNAV